MYRMRVYSTEDNMPRLKSSHSHNNNTDKSDKHGMCAYSTEDKIKDVSLLHTYVQLLEPDYYHYLAATEMLEIIFMFLFQTVPTKRPQSVQSADKQFLGMKSWETESNFFS